MATATVTDDFSVLHACDAVGTWTSTTGTSPKVEGTDFKEGSGSIACLAYQAGGEDQYFTGGPWNLSSTHIRFWLNFVFVNYLNTLGATGGAGIQLFMGDGTNTGYWYLDGSDTYTGGWKNYVVDTSLSPDSGTQPTMSAITDIGIWIELTSNTKRIECLYLDNFVYGSGITITGGTSGDKLDMDDIESVSNNTTNAHGVIRKVGKVYFLSGEVNFGAGTGTSNCYFEDTDCIFVFEDAYVNSSLYDINFQSSGLNTTDCTFGAISNGLTTGGCVFTADRTGTYYSGTLEYTVTCTDTDMNVLNMYGCKFTRAAETYFGNASTELTGTNLGLVNTSWENCGSVFFNISDDDSEIRGCTFASSSDTAAVELYELHTSGLESPNVLANTRGLEVNVASEDYYIWDAVFSGNTNDIYFSNASGNPKLYATDSTPDEPTIGDAGGLINYEFYERTTYNLTVNDGSGDPIESAGVRLADKNDNTDFTVLTSNLGEIAEQYVIRRKEVKVGGATTEVTYNPFSLRIRRYGYIPQELTKEFATRAITDVVQMLDDDTATDSIYTVASWINHITINETPTPDRIELSTVTHTLKEVYEFLQYHLSMIDHLDLVLALETADGVTYLNDDYDFQVDTVTLTGSSLILSMPTKDFTTASGGSHGLKKLTDIDGTEVVLKLDNVVVGSRCAIYDENDVQLMNELAVSSEVTEPYTHTADKALTIRVRKSSASPKYKPFSAGGTVTSDGFSGYVIQEPDDIA